MFKPRRVFGIPILDGLIIELVELLGTVAFIIVMVPLTLVILALSFVAVFVVSLSVAWLLAFIGVPREVYSGPLAVVALIAGLGLTVVGCVKAFKRLPTPLRNVIIGEPPAEGETEAPAPARRRTQPELLAEVAELDALLAPRAGDGGD